MFWVKNMFDLHIDLGQIIIASLLATVGFFIKNEINRLNLRLDTHENRIIALVGDLQKVIGIVGVLDRTFERNKLGRD